MLNNDTWKAPFQEAIAKLADSYPDKSFSSTFTRSQVDVILQSLGCEFQAAAKKIYNTVSENERLDMSDPKRSRNAGPVSQMFLLSSAPPPQPDADPAPAPPPQPVAPQPVGGAPAPPQRFRLTSRASRACQPIPIPTVWVQQKDIPQRLHSELFKNQGKVKKGKKKSPTHPPTHPLTNEKIVSVFAARF